MYHQPALLHECIEGLSINPSGIYADLTFGGGGHSVKILEKLSKKGLLIAFDQDEDAIQNAPKAENFILLNENFRYLKNFLRLYEALPLDGILADLGISSHQIDTPHRGFATRFEGPLDMRMNKNQPLDAAHIINTYPEEKLISILKLYGEIGNARNLVSKIISARSNKIETISEFKEIIKPCVPRQIEHKYLAQVFQALRIEVNDEMGALQSMLKHAVNVLKPGGRLVIISYHSLEDRLVKNFIRSGNFEGNIEKDFFGNILTPFKSITRKPIVPSTHEIEQNPRVRSAKLRIAEKL